MTLGKHQLLKYSTEHTEYIYNRIYFVHPKLHFGYELAFYISSSTVSALNKSLNIKFYSIKIGEKFSFHGFLKN